MVSSNSYKCWNSENAYEMAKLIRESGMSLNDEEFQFVKKVIESDPNDNFSVYDLYQLNTLCYMAQGYLRTSCCRDNKK